RGVAPRRRGDGMSDICSKRGRESWRLAVATRRKSLVRSCPWAEAHGYRRDVAPRRRGGRSRSARRLKLQTVTRRIPLELARFSARPKVFPLRLGRNCRGPLGIWGRTTAPASLWPARLACPRRRA